MVMKKRGDLDYKSQSQRNHIAQRPQPPPHKNTWATNNHRSGIGLPRRSGEKNGEDVTDSRTEEGNLSHSERGVIVIGKK